MSLLPLEEARARVMALARTTGIEEIALRAAAGRVLAGPLLARQSQPPFAASAMDGYAVTEAQPGATLRVIGEAAAGRRFEGPVGAGEAVRIFTGAPVPEGARRIVIQEDVTRTGDRITLGESLDAGPYIRPAGGDFKRGDSFGPNRPLTPTDLTLLAAMNHARLPVRARPKVAIIATGDELVAPGDSPGPDQILGSNGFGVGAMLEAAGAAVRLLPIARDTAAHLRATFALAADADLIVTIGGASVGDHDLVGAVAAELGLKRAFYKIAMRPGKPLMAGRMGDAAMVGLPGNPVSALICARVFLVPLIGAMLGLPDALEAPVLRSLAADIGANGPRTHYMRATLGADGRVTVAPRQDSSLLSVLAQSDTLVLRPPQDPARLAGELVPCLPL